MSRTLLAAAAAAFTLLAAPALAATLVIDAAGTFAGYDPNDVLGAPKDGLGQVSDVAFTASMTFTLTGADHFVDNGTDTYGNGANYGTGILSAATFTIGGVDYEILGFGQGVALQNLMVTQQLLSRYVSGGPLLLLGAASPDDVMPALVDDPPTGNICGYASCYGRVVLSNGIEGALAPISYTVTLSEVDPEYPDGPAPVPEPSTWALLIGGFGLTGAALRRRRVLA